MRTNRNTLVTLASIAAAVVGFASERWFRTPEAAPLGRDAAPAEIARTPEELAAVTADLRGRYRTSPKPAGDFPLRADAARILATMSAAKLRSFSNSLEDCSEYSHSLTFRDSWHDVFRADVIRQWGRKDPADACFSRHDGRVRAHPAVFEDWLARDPAAARAWLDGMRFPTEARNEPMWFRSRLIHHIARGDLAEAELLRLRLPADLRGQVLRVWCTNFGSDPSKRIALLETIGKLDDPELADELRRDLVRAAAERSTEEAGAFLAKADLPEEIRRGLRHEVLYVMSRDHPEEAFADWVAMKEEELPTPMRNAMTMWTSSPSGTTAAIQWVMELDPGPAREMLKSGLVDSLLSSLRYDRAGDVSRWIIDPAERARQMKNVYRKWTGRDPEACFKWVADMTPEDREILRL